MLNAVASVLAIALAAPCMVRAQDTPQERAEFASQVIGLNLAHYEAVRSGDEPADGAVLYPTVWSWKEPAYTDMCSEAVGNITDGNATASMLGTYGGFFEAGNAVTATGTMSFGVVQRLIGALEFMPYLEGTITKNAIGDPAGCLAGMHSSSSLKFMVLREARFAAKSLAATVLSTAPDNFVMLVGVGDTSTYRDDAPLPSWLVPDDDQQKCYIADEDNPAADIAAQLAAALALSAKMAREHGTAEDRGMADEWEAKAVAAYDYANRMVAEFTLEGSTCSMSSTAENCVGSSCTDTDPDDGSVTEGTCTLYPNGKPPMENLFVANAALWYVTGDARYRAAADEWYEQSFAGTFALNWNNVVPQGLMLMSAAPDSPGATNSKTFYQNQLATGAEAWAACSNDGEALHGDGKAFCKRTPDGSAYPLDSPWGNTGLITNGLCIAALTEKYQIDPSNSARNRCFMQRQIGYLFNHKCATCTEIPVDNDTKDFNNTICSACDTPGSEGFSYMVGLGKHFPTRLHSRDASYPNFDEEYLPDGNLMCGALVAGPFAHGNSGVTGRAESGTDLYTNNRDLWYEAEPALDYSASMICAMAGYASLQGPITDCDARTPLTGRGDDASDEPVGGASAPAEASIPLALSDSPGTTPMSAPVAPVVGVNVTTGGEDCGMGGEPVCEGDDLDGREFECDYGFTGEDGVCVDYTPRSELAPPPTSMMLEGPCGKEEEPVCAGEMLNGRQFECDFGFTGVGGVCVPYKEAEEIVSA